MFIAKRQRSQHISVQSLSVTILATVTSLLLAGCGKTPPVTTAPPPPQNSNAVATVNGATISRQALEEKLKRGGRGATPQSALEDLIRTEAIYQKALAAGFDGHPEVQARIRNLIVAQFRERQVRPTNTPSVTDGEIQAAYEAQKERFQTPVATRGAVIFIEAPRTATPEKRTELRQRAEAVLAEARSAADERTFGQVVAQYSEDRPTRYRGGDTGWIGRDGTDNDPALTEALLKLANPGEFAPLVETPRGFYIAKLIGKREPGNKPVDEVKEAIRYQLSRQKAEQAERDFYAAMQSGLDIQINRTVLDSISLPAPVGEPPALPGATTAQLQ